MIQPFNPQLGQQVQQFVQAEQMNRPGPIQGMMPQDRRFAEQAQDDQFTTNMAQIASTERTWGKKNELDYMAHQERLGEQRRQFDETNRIREEDRKLLEERSRRLMEGKREVLRRQLDRANGRRHRNQERTESIDAIRSRILAEERALTKAAYRMGRDRGDLQQKLAQQRSRRTAEARMFGDQTLLAGGSLVGGITADLAGPQVSDTAPIAEMFSDSENMPAGGDAFADYMGYDQVDQMAMNDPNFARTGVSDTGRVNKSVATRVGGTLRELTGRNLPDTFTEDLRQILDGMSSGNLDEETLQTRIDSMTGALRQTGISPVQFMAILEKGQQGLVESIGRSVDGLDLGGERLGVSIHGEDGQLQAISPETILGDDLQEALRSEGSLNAAIAQMPLGTKDLTEGIARYFGAGDTRLDTLSENFGLLENVNRQIHAANSMRRMADLLEASGIPNQTSIAEELAVLDEIEIDSRSNFEDAILGGNYSGLGDMEYSTPSLVDDVRGYMEANNVVGDYDWLGDLEAFEERFGDFRSQSGSTSRQIASYGDDIEDLMRATQREQNAYDEEGSYMDELAMLDRMLDANP